MHDYDKIAARLENASNVLIAWILKLLHAFDFLCSLFKKDYNVWLIRHQHISKTEHKELSVALCVILGSVNAAFSSFSVCLFHFFRAVPGAEKYYVNPTLSLTRDVIDAMLRSGLIVLLVLAAVYAWSLRKGWMRGLACKLTALPLALNMIISLSMEHSELQEIFLPGDAWIGRIALNAITFYGFAVLLSMLIGWIFHLIDKNRARPFEEGRANRAVLLGYAFAVILVGWVPAMVACYPGGIAQDTLWQIQSFMGEKPLDASHPALTTIFYGWLFSNGRHFGDDASSLFKINLIQAVVNALSMGLVCTRAYKYTGSRLFFYCSVLYYGIAPVWQMTAVKAVKDVIHTGWYLLFYLQFLSCIEKKEFSLLDYVWLIVCSLMVSFTRKATYYLALLCLIVLILKNIRHHFLQFAACLLVLVSVFTAYNQILLPSLHFRPEKERENYSLQFQQVALYCKVYADELTDEEKEIINGTLDLDRIVANYTPMISDDVKATYHGTAEDHEAFWDLYHQMLRRHPLFFVRSTLMTSFEHINPWYDHNFTGAIYISKNEDFYHIDFANWKLAKQMFAYWSAWSEYPFERLMCGNGLAAWLLIVMLGYSLKARSGLSLMGLAPHLFLLIGLFMSHVNGLIRYGYPLIAATPLILAFVGYGADMKKRTEPQSPLPQHQIPPLSSVYEDSVARD